MAYTWPSTRGDKGSDWGLVASTDFKSDGSGLILGTVGSIPTHFRHAASGQVIQQLKGILLSGYVVNGKQSIVRAESSFRHLERHLGNLGAVEPLAIARYIQTRLKEGAARATVNRELAALERAYNLAVRQGVLASRPYIPQLRENNVRKGFLSAEKLHRLFVRVPSGIPPAFGPRGLCHRLAEDGAEPPRVFRRLF